MSTIFQVIAGVAIGLALLGCGGSKPTPGPTSTCLLTVSVPGPGFLWYICNKTEVYQQYPPEAVFQWMVRDRIVIDAELWWNNTLYETPEPSSIVEVNSTQMDFKMTLDRMNNGSGLASVCAFLKLDMPVRLILSETSTGKCPSCPSDDDKLLVVPLVVQTEEYRDCPPGVGIVI